MTTKEPTQHKVKRDLLKLQELVKPTGTTLEVMNHPLYSGTLISVSISHPSSSTVPTYAFINNDDSKFENAPTDSYEALLTYFEEAAKDEANAVYKAINVAVVKPDPDDFGGMPRPQ